LVSLSSSVEVDGADCRLLLELGMSDELNT
jgi:hypothetical protein